MEEIILGPIKYIWPYYILAFFLAEILLLIKERKSLYAELVAAFVFVVVLTGISLFADYNSWSFKNRPILLVVVIIIQFLTPVVITVFSIQFISKIKSLLVKHFTLFTVIIITMLFWPLWSLYVICASGLDCI